MSGFDAIIRGVEDRLRRDLGIDAGLGAALVELSADGQADSAEAVRRLLRRRVRDLRAAVDRVQLLEQQVDSLARILPFTEAGWEPRRQLLARALEEDPSRGTRLWLADCYAAVAEVRLDALRRLVGLPGPPEPLRERMRTLVAAFEGETWPTVVALVEPGAVGVEVGGASVPADDVRGRLASLLVRLGLARPGGADLESWHREADRLGAGATSAALLARSERERGHDRESDAWLARAVERGPTDLDVAVEQVVRARRAGDPAQAEEVARNAVDALPLLADVERAVGALLYEPPAELWVAVADRALRSGDPELLERALGRGDQAVGWTDYPVRARLAELRVARAEAAQVSAAELVALHVRAGTERLWSGAFDAAAGQLEAALALDPDDVDTRLVLADCLVTGNGQQPLRHAGAAVRRALGLVQVVQAEDRVSEDRAWSYATESYARQALLRGIGPEAEAHRWPMLLAACRGTALGLGEWTRWRTLADAFSAVRADELALDAARHVVTRMGSGDEERQLHSEKLANTGRPDQAIAALDLPGDVEEGTGGAFGDAVRAYCILRLGDPVESTKLLRGADLDPDWTWATEALITSLLLTGRITEAEAEIAVLERHWLDRPDEHPAVLSLAGLRLLQGRFGEAAELAGSVSDQEDEAAAYTVAAALLLQGDVDGGRREFERWVELAGRRGLHEWDVLSAPQLRVLAVHYRAPTLDLSAVGRLVQARRDAFPDVVALPLEAGRVGACARQPDDPDAELAILMCDALLRVARDDVPGAIAVLEAGRLDAPAERLLQLLRQDREPRPVVPGPDEEVGEKDRPTGPDELAARCVSAAAQDRRDDAATALTGLLDLVGVDDAALWLKDAVAEDHPGFEALIALVGELAGEGADPGPLRSLVPALEALVSLRLLLPASWFAGHDDPVATHPIFVRYIPEARLRDPAMPPVRVGAEEALEPGGYLVMRGTRLVEQGVVDPLVHYADPAAAPVLPLDPEAVVGPTGVVPLAVEATDGGLGGLLAMSAFEVVVRRVQALHAVVPAP